MNINKIPKELKQRPQWVLWKLQDVIDKKTKLPKINPQTGLPEQAKVPYQIYGEKASTINPKTWTSFEKALHAYQKSPGTFNGIGYVFSESDPYTGIDLDKCFTDGQLSDHAQKVIERFNSYSERSQSGAGVHILVKAQLPGKGKHIKGYEVYDQVRFFVVTGDHIEGTPETIEERQQEVTALYAYLIEPEVSTRKPIQSSSVTMEDQAIIDKASRAKNGSKFTALYSGDWSGYNSQSEADLALCNLLAFYTQDEAQIERIFAGSGLYREKWERGDYREQTINKALQATTAQYEGKKNSPIVLGMRSPKFETGDVGNSQRLLHHCGEDLRYCGNLKSWFVWDGTRWDHDDKDRRLTLAMGIAQKIEDEEIKPEMLEAEKIDKKLRGEKEDRLVGILNALRAQAKLARSERGIKAMLNLAAPKLAVTVDEMDADIWKLNVLNGVIDLKTGELLPHDRAEFITKLAHVVSDPTAKAPRWEQFLTEVMVDESGSGAPLFEDIKELRKFLGYALTGSVREQKFIIAHGKLARNGKGTLFNLVQKLMGDYAQVLDPLTLMSHKNKEGGRAEPGIAKLRGIRYIVTSESSRGHHLDEAKVKNLTGRDPITTRGLYESEFTFQPQFKVFLQTNMEPAMDGGDNGIWARIDKFNFNRHFKPDEQDKDLPDKLEAELSGILNWLVKGCRLWQREGLKETEAMRRNKRTYREDMDEFSRYVEDCLYFDPGAAILPKDLMDNYFNWCYENSTYGHTSAQVFNRKLEKVMAERGHTFIKNKPITPKGDKTVRWHVGVGLLERMPKEWRNQAAQTAEGSRLTKLL